MAELRKTLDRWLAPLARAGLSTGTPAAVAPETANAPSLARGPRLDPIGEPAAGEVLDLQAIESIRSLQRPGESSLLEKILGMYRNNTPPLLDQLARAVDGGDAGAVQHAAHALKSSSANVGAKRVAALSKELESKARARDLFGAQEQLAQLRAAFAEAERAHTQLLESGRHAS
jgi:HPt (histidine-containing phosphotransfer) domain-containing protein